MHRILLLILVGFPCYLMATTHKLPVLIAHDVHQQYKRVNAQYDIIELERFDLLPQSRDLIDLIILIKALNIGGCDCQLQFHDNSVYGRNIELLISGQFVMSSDTLWLSDITRYQDMLIKSPAVIKNGDYDVGLYTSSQNHTALNAKSSEDIKSLTAVSNRFWSADWRTMRALSPKKLAHVESWARMEQLVNAQLADYTLMHFRNPKLSRTPLVPIPNVKAILWDSRHFAIARQHPLAQHVKNALDIGLKKLAKRGLLERAYQQVGISHQSQKNWQILNPKSQ